MSDFNSQQEGPLNPRGVFAASFEACFPESRSPMTGAGMTEIDGQLRPVYAALGDNTILAMMVYRANCVGRILNEQAAFPYQVEVESPGVARLKPSKQPVISDPVAWSICCLAWRDVVQSEPPRVPNLEPALTNWRGLLRTLKPGGLVHEEWIIPAVAGQAAHRLIQGIDQAECAFMLRPHHQESPA